jgi:hypothetical protein
MPNLGDDLDKLAALEQREQILARRLKDAKAEREAWERECFDRMVGEGWNPNESTLNRNGFKFRPKSTTFAVVQDKAALKAWLLTYDEGLVDDKFKQAELNRLVRERLDNGETLPPGLGYYDKTAVSKSGIMQKEVDDEGE